MELTEAQQVTIIRAIELLTPFNKESISYWTTYWEEGEEGNSEQHDHLSDRENDTCDTEDCIEEMRCRLQIKYPTLKITDRRYMNDGDHDSIESCNVCARPLNQFLTWIREEFEHHKIHSLDKVDITHSRTAFDIICMLGAMPSNDYEPSPYSRNTEKDPYEHQRKFIEEVVDYAQLIINLLN